MINSIHRFIAVIALLVVTSNASAQIAPATLGDPTAESYFINYIAFPETQGDANVNIFCEAVVKANGKFRFANCAIRNAWEPDFVAAINKATKKGVLQPATENGKGVEVIVYFQVEFLKKDEQFEINIVLNSAVTENVEEYGPNHIGAQRAYQKEYWQKVCPKRAGWTIYALAHVDDQGVASSVNLEHGAGIVPTGQCQAAIIDTVASSRFAPTTVDGVAVPSSYIEPFGN